MRGRIKVGSLVSQDSRNYYWPIGDADPDTVFEMTWISIGKYVKCSANEFGELRGAFRDGAIYVFKGPKHHPLYIHLCGQPERKP